MTRRRVRDQDHHLAAQQPHTHYMEEAERLCDRAAIMDSGRIVAVDEPRSLMEEHGGNLEDVYLKLTGRSLED